MRLFRALAAALALAIFLPALAIAGAPPFVATPVPRYLSTGVQPGTMMRSAIAKIEQGKPVVVCMLGDSEYTGPVNAASINDSIWQQIQAAYQAQNPGVSFTFTNYSVGGTSYGSVTKTNISGPALWFQYVNQGQCDIVHYGFGVNDFSYVGGDILFSDINNIAQAASHPAQIFMTSIVANAAAGAPYSNTANQIGNISSAGLIRSIVHTGTAGWSTKFTAPIPQLGIIDVNRYWQQAVLGKDYSDLTAISYPALTNTTATLAPGVSYLFPATDGDFDIAVTIPGGMAALPAAGTSIFFVTGASDGATQNESSTYIAISGTGVYVSNGVSGNSTFSNGFTSGATDLTVEIAVKDSYFYEIVNGNTIAKHFLRSSGPFTPQMYIGSSATASVPVKITKYAGSKARSYNPVLSNLDAYGPVGAAAPLLNAVAAGGSQLTFSTAALKATPAIVGGGILDSTSGLSFPSTSLVTAITNNGDGTSTVTINGVAGSSGVAAGDSIFMSGVAASGGNGINHTASASLNYVFKTVLDATDLHLLPWTESRSANQSRMTVAALDGGSTAATQSLMHLSLNPAAVINTYTVTLPPYPYAGDTFELTDDSTYAVNGVTVAAPSGASVVNQGSTVTMTTGTSHLWRYNAALPGWVQRY